jgi:hypothetical protein
LEEPGSTETILPYSAFRGSQDSTRLPQCPAAAMRLPSTRVFNLLPCLALLFAHLDLQAQTRTKAIHDIDVQKLANGVLGIMTYTVAPDVTTSSLSISNATATTTDLALSQLGGGFTWSKDTPLYLEGNAAYSRYDPVFVATDGTDERRVPVKWNSFSATGGIGWDLPISESWVFRPIFCFTLGQVASDLKVAKWWVGRKTDADLSFLDSGKLDAYGLGGALMLDYESFSAQADDDIELRYSNVELRSQPGSSLGVEGRAKAESISIWARRRVPTGWGMVWDRPVRYVYEVAHTRFLGNENDAGLSNMSSLGFGLELDSSAHDVWATRWRAVGRYKFGPGMHGWSLGLALSF